MFWENFLVPGSFNILRQSIVFSQNLADTNSLLDRDQLWSKQIEYYSSLFVSFQCSIQMVTSLALITMCVFSF